MTTLITRLATLLLMASLGLTAGCQSEARSSGASGKTQLRATKVLESAVLHERRTINIALPPDYDASDSTRYPVLYMPDGGLAEDFPHVVAAAQKLMRKGAMRAFIVVGIENTERRRDLTGPTDVEENRKIAANVGGSAAFRSFIRDELKPLITAEYRTTSESAIIGESLAGLFIVETFFVEPALFDHYIALSPSIWWNDEALVKNAAHGLQTMAPLTRAKSIYLTSADETNIVPGTAAIADALKTSAPEGLIWLFEPRPKEHHDTIYLASESRALSAMLGPIGKSR